MPVRPIPGKYIPGQMSKGMINELGRLQTQFLDELTMPEDEAHRARKAWPDYYPVRDN